MRIRITGHANLGQVKKEFAEVEAMAKGASIAMHKSFVNPTGKINPAGAVEAQKQMRAADMAFRSAVASSGQFYVEQVRVNKATDDYIERLRRQKIAFGELRRSRNLAKAAFIDQIALQRSHLAEFRKDVATNRPEHSLLIPKRVHQDWITLRKRLGFIGYELSSLSRQMVNWGKNTQWAGRQLMVGFTLPLAVVGAATGTLAYKVDQEMTRIRKVYDTTADATSNSLRDQMAVQREFADLEQESFHTAASAAKQYGYAINDTLQMQAEFAATGLQGAELQKTTSEAIRVATLGEIDRQTAIDSTIALQSVFKMSNEELTESFNYMNAVENATSLQLKDFAEAIPIAAGPIKSFGGDVKELGVLLTAMRQNGIRAREGANAIKAAMSRIGRPSKIIKQEFAEMTGMDLEKMIKDSGSLTEVFTRLNEISQDMDASEQRKLFAGLFGTYQVTRMQALVSGMDDIKNGTGQVSDTLKIAGQDAEQWADAAEKEMTQYQESASGKLKNMIESLKVEFAKMGEPFLEIAGSLVGAVTKVVSKFNELPGMIKKIGLGTLLFGAVAGPIIMVAGLIPNLIGNIGLLGAWFVKLAGDMKLVNQTEYVQQQSAKATAHSLENKVTATQHLKTHTEAMTQSLRHAINTMREMQGLGPIYNAADLGMTTTAVAPRQGFTPIANKYPISVNTADPAVAISKGQLKYNQKNLEVEKRRFHSGKAIGRMAGVASAAMAAQLFTSNKLVDSVANYAMGFSLALPALSFVLNGMRELPGLLKKIRIGEVLGRGVEHARHGVTRMHDAMKGYRSAVADAGGGLRGHGRTLTQMIGKANLIAAGIAAVGAALYMTWKRSRDLAKEWEELNNVGEGIADIYGVVAKDTDQVLDKNGKVVDAEQERFKKLREEVGGYIDKIKEADSKVEAFNIAQSVGAQTFKITGDAEAAKQSVEDALKMARGVAEGEEIFIMFKAQTDFSNVSNLLMGLTNDVRTSIDEALSFEMPEQDWSEKWGLDDLPGNVWDALTSNPFNGQNPFANMLENADNMELPNAAIKAAEKAGNGIASTISQAIQFGDEDVLLDALTRSDVAVAELQERIKSARDSGDIIEEIQNTKILEQVVTNIAKANQMSDEEIQGVLAGVREGNSILGAMGYNASAISDEVRYQFLANKDNLTAEESRTMSMLALKREASGVADETENAGDAQRKHKEEVKKTREEAKKLREEESKIAVEAAQSAWTGVVNDIADQISDDFDRRQEAAITAREQYWERQSEALSNAMERESEAMDRKWENASESLDNRWERAHAAFERRWDAREKRMEKSYDRRIKNIERTIEAEEKAEEIRQRIFEAERKRVERMTERKNAQIDVNVALATGEFDEAAKTMNTLFASESEWSLSDQEEKAERKSQRNIDRLDKRKERLDEERKAEEDNLKRIRKMREDAMKQREDREKKSMDRREKREKKHLDRLHKQREKDLQRRTDSDMEAIKKTWAAEKKSLDDRLELFKAYIPRNERELKKHMRNVLGKYTDFGGTMKEKGGKWATVIGNSLTKHVNLARAKLSTDKRWAQLGKKTAKEIFDKSLGMTPKQFSKWMSSGNYPNLKNISKTVGGDRNPPGRGRNRPARNSRTGRAVGQSTGPRIAHEGGWVGKGKDSRKGVAKNTRGVHSSERELLARKGEFVVNEKSAAKYGDVLEKLNNNKVPTSKNRGHKGGKGGKGGAGGNFGMAGLIAMMGVGAMHGAIRQGITEMHERQMQLSAGVGAGSFLPGKAGMYSDRAFSKEALRNAATIASVGSGMGMSARDIMIGIMTAITESGLVNVNYGDRDSLGLFQQRPSMGWGSPEQVTNPEYAAKKFFSVLKGVQNRNDLSPWMAAQTVQRSAFSDGSNFRQYWDNAQAIFKNGLEKSGASGYRVGSGGWSRPMPRGYSFSNGHDAGMVVGTPVYAVANGRIVKSKATTSGGSPQHAKSYPKIAPNGKPYRSYGETIGLKTGAGIINYAHLQPGSRLPAGSVVKGGSQIARSGNTGNSSGPHLHVDVGGRHVINTLLRSKGVPMRSGGYTKSDGPANLHSDELVLSPSKTQEFYDGIKGLRQFDQAALERIAEKAAGRGVQNVAKKSGNRSKNTNKNANKNAGAANDPINELAGGRAGGGGNIKMGTYNVLFKTKNAKTIRDLAMLTKKVDLLSLTEMSKKKRPGIVKWLRENGWGWHGSPTSAGIAWNKSAYDLKRKGIKQLNRTTGFRPATNKKYAAYAKFRDRDSGRDFWQIAAHTVPNAQSTAIRRRIQREQFNTLGRLYNNLSRSATTFLSGDFNADPRRIKHGRKIGKAKSNWLGRMKGNVTFGRSYLDHIFSNSNLKSQRVIKGLSSDHNALIANFGLPSLKTGGRIKHDNTLANLHRRETVLTAPLTDKLETGIERFESGGDVQYNFNINGVDKDAKEIAHEVKKIMDREEKRKPRPRR